MTWPFSGFEWTRTRLVALACASFLLGLILARHGWATNWQLCFASLLILTFTFRNPKIFFLPILITALNLGILRGQITIKSYYPLLSQVNQKVIIQGTIQDDAGITDRKQTEFHLDHLVIINKNEQVFSGGRLRIRGFPNNKLARGDVVQVEGRLRPALGNQQGQISFAKITILEKHENPIDSLRRRFIAGTYSALPDIEASLGLGFLVGTRSLLPDSLEKALAITGLTHIVAVSGYNLTILVRFTRRLLVKSSKYIATAVSVALILGFIAITGISPSIFRAAVVSIISLAAWYYGRPLKPTILLLVAAAITAGLNPSYIWYDIGWYLSFLAFYGILILAPTISARIFRDKKPHAFWQLIIETISAQVMTLPLIIFIFSRASLISFFANLLVLPLVPAGMLLTLIAGLSGMLIPMYAGWISWAGYMLLHFNVLTIERLAGIVWASKSISMVPWQLIVIYLSIFSIQLIMFIKAKPDFKSQNSIT